MKEKYKLNAMEYKAVILSEEIREKASELDNILEKLPTSREKSLALTKLEESVMWANKALAMHSAE